MSVLERKISMRKPREELVKRGVLLEDPEQGEFFLAHELVIHLSVSSAADLPLTKFDPLITTFK